MISHFLSTMSEADFCKFNRCLSTRLTPVGIFYPSCREHILQTSLGKNDNLPSVAATSTAIGSGIKDEKPFPTGAYVQIGSFMGRYYYQNNKLMRFKPANEPDLYKNSNDVFSFNTIDEELGKRKMAFQKRGE